MNNKIPCGGFYLSDTLGVDENGKLGVNGGEPYKSLVTDGEGGVKWEDRLAYDYSRPVIDLGSFQAVYVCENADELNTTEGSKLYCTFSNGSDSIVSLHFVGNCIYSDNNLVFITLVDNVDMGEGFVFPKKGLYLYKDDTVFVNGVADLDGVTDESGQPEPVITWDGSVGEIKTIDPKYIPSELNEVILPSSTSGSSKKFKITVDDSGTISATEVTP